MLLITQKQRNQLVTNFHHRYHAHHDPVPVVKLYTPWTAATWLLTEADPGYPDIVFGLCDLGAGQPELGCVSLSEIQRIKGPWELKVQRDRYFRSREPLSAWTAAARRLGYIPPHKRPAIAGL